MYDNQQTTTYWQAQRTAPYAVASLVLGVVSLLSSALGLTLVLGILGIVYSNRGLAECRRQPGLYSGEGMLVAGKVTSIIGVVLGGIALLMLVLMIILGIGLISAGVLSELT